VTKARRDRLSSTQLNTVDVHTDPVVVTLTGQVPTIGANVFPQGQP
jgi:hypothetical protein